MGVGGFFEPWKRGLRDYNWKCSNYIIVANPCETHKLYFDIYELTCSLHHWEFDGGCTGAGQMRCGPEASSGNSQMVLLVLLAH